MFFVCDECNGIWLRALSGDGTPVCCDKTMRRLKPQAPDNQHLIVTDFSGDRVRITIGETPHPMDFDHRIEMIMLKTRDRVFIKRIIRAKRASAVFHGIDVDFRVYALCSRDGLFCNKILKKSDDDVTFDK